MRDYYSRTRDSQGRLVLSARRLWVILDQAPNSSRFKAALSGDEDNDRWSSVEHLLATIADHMQQTNRLLYVQLSGKSPPTFEAHPKPGKEQEKRDDAEEQRGTIAHNYLSRFTPGGPGASGDSPLKLQVRSERADQPPK